jgi:two-component system, response regulator YesN
MKLLIADDEAQTRLGLVKGIDWKSIGITEVFMAEDGLEALECVSLHHPEIIITDIRMPGVDGLQLSREALKIDSEIKIIIISSYSEFEYAKQAIQIGATEYFLKPIDIDALLSKVSESIKKINERKQNQNILDDIHKQALLQQWEQWYMTHEDEEHGLPILQSLLGIKIDKTFSCCLFALDKNETDNISKKILYMTMCIEPYLSQNERILPFLLGFGVFVLSQSSLIHNVGEFQQRMAKCHQALKTSFYNQFQTTISLAQGDVYKANEMYFALNQCEKIMSHRMYLGKGQVITHGVLNDLLSNYYAGFDEEQLRRHIAEMDFESVMSFIKCQIFEPLRLLKTTSYPLISSVCVQIKNMLLRRLEEVGIPLESIMEKNQFLLSDVPHYIFLEEYYQWVEDIYFLILQGCKTASASRHSTIIANALVYINIHYAQDISLDMVATHVRKSKNYFSYLFKKELDISFVEYLSKYRVEKAKQLLETTDFATYQISEMVGFNDYKYFSTVFRKIEGVPPTAYRTKGTEKLE